MDKERFHQRLKYIYSHTKRGEYDSSFEDIRDAFMADIIGKSNGNWDETIATEVMRIAEHIFGIQPVATQLASKITSSDAEKAVEKLLTDRGVSYTHIPESNTQTPDGSIEGLGAKYLCEIKSPQQIFDHKAAPFGYKHATTHRKLLDAIHKAKRQLEKLNSDHSFPHILIYTSAHPQLNYSNFIDAIRGYIATANGEVTTDLRNTDIFKKTIKIINDIDLYIFLRIGSGKQIIQVTYFNNQQSAHADAIDKLIAHLKLNPISAFDGHVSIQDICRELK